MIQELRTTLGVLEGQLHILWTDYLTSRPKDWLYDRRKASARITEMQNVRRVIQIVQDHINNIFQVLDDPLLGPNREKEN